MNLQSKFLEAFHNVRQRQTEQFKRDGNLWTVRSDCTSYSQPFRWRMQYEKVMSKRSALVIEVTLLSAFSAVAVTDALRITSNSKFKGWPRVQSTGVRCGLLRIEILMTYVEIRLHGQGCPHTCKSQYYLLCKINKPKWTPTKTRPARGMEALRLLLEVLLLILSLFTR